MFVVVGSSFMSEHTPGCYGTVNRKRKRGSATPTSPQVDAGCGQKSRQEGRAVGHSLEENARLRVCLAGVGVGVGDTQQPPPPTQPG